jgi:4-amino-4-deoxy-L-arabinose transferase-like glycosyltransferase
MRALPYGPLLLGAAIYLALQSLCMGVASIAGSSEAREAQVVSVILREGSWVLPMRNGVIPSKPPLYHWAAALVSMASGGVSEFSVRMTSQLATAVCFLLVAIVAYRMAALQTTFQGAGHPRRASLLTAGILSLTYGFYIMGCQAMVDMTFAVCVWASFAALVSGIVPRGGEDGARKLHWMGRAGFWLCACTAVLARGPLGLLLPLSLVGIGGLVVVGFRRTVREFLTPSVGWLAIGIPMFWYWKAYLVGGEAFLERQIFFENIKRFSGGEFVNSEAWWFYLPSILRTTFPWGLLLLYAVVRDFRIRASLSYRRSSPLVRWLPSILLVAGMVMLSLSSGKRHSYLLPLLPMVALQLGVEVSSLLEYGGVSIRQRIHAVGTRIEYMLVLASLCILVGLSTVFASGLIANQLVVQTYAAVAPALVRISGVIVVLSLLLFAWQRRSVAVVSFFAWLLMLCVMTAVVSIGAAVKGYCKGFDAMAATWLATARAGDTLAVFKHPFDEYFDPLLFYIRRPARLIPLEAVAGECQENTVYAAKRSWLDAHEGLFGGVVVRVAAGRERLHKGEGRHEQRDVVFFRCSTHRLGESETPATFQDAALQRS